jgi:hypothetical protein
MTTAAQPTGKELDEALVRAIRELIATSVQAETRAAAGMPDTVSPAA